MPATMSFHTGGRPSSSSTPRGTPRSADLDTLRTQVKALTLQLDALGGMNERRSKVQMGPDVSDAARKKACDQLRQRLIDAQQHVGEAQTALNKLLLAASATSRAGHLRSLPELIGPPPPDRTWEDEWIKLKAESYRISGQGEASVEEDEAYVREHESLDKYLKQDGVNDDIGYLVSYGWPPERAKIYALLYTCLDALGCALRERSPRYAASTYAISEALFAQRKGADGKADDNSRKSVRSAAKAHVQPVYAHLHGMFSLSARDPAWSRIEEPDNTGFRGLTSSALVHASCDAQNFTEEGYQIIVTDPNDPSKAGFEVQESDIVCFVSMKDDEHGAHSAIITSDTSGDFPPNTLFRLAGVHEPGTWEAPGGVMPNQRLLEVTATYQPPHAGLVPKDSGGSKMCGSAVTLSYKNREAFMRGLDDLIAKPSLTMADEFMRDDTWVDWKGVSYTSREEWAYVNGPAETTPNCTPGTRDANNGGKTPAQFLEQANAFIRQRREGQGLGLTLPEDHAYLNVDEVLAVRLYTGPAYQPINTFLRQISSLTDNFRAAIAQHPGLTYAATVGHICRAIRKLAAVASVEEATAPLYRGVRGELERAFWLPDAQGMVCAVDMAFMSTSRQRTAPIMYMDPSGKNVLWQLNAAPESDSGFHRGADVDLLSQFAGEQECLFPPCTMLAVREEAKLAAARLAGDLPRVERLEASNKHDVYGTFEAKEVTEASKSFTSVTVLPTFL